MGQDTKLSHLVTLLSDLDYPISRDAMADQYEETTLLLADGELNLGALIASGDTSDSDEQFDSVDDVVLDVMNRLPRRAVGEPYQSEGEG